MLKNYEEITEQDRDAVSVKSNYHTHNYLCGHAAGTACDYVREAVRCGLETIGISDHCLPSEHTGAPYLTPRTLRTLYMPQIAEAREKYGKDIKILAGAELEYFSGNDDYYRNLLDPLDYLVLGQHEFNDERGVRFDSFFEGTDEKTIEAYCRSVVRGLKTGMFSVLAHPDLIFYRRAPVTPRVRDAFDDMIRTAVLTDTVVELNANGIRSHGFKYPTDLVAELCKKYDAPVVVSSDCHYPSYLCDNYMTGLLAYAIKNRLNVVDKIKTFEDKK